MSRQSAPIDPFRGFVSFAIALLLIVSSGCGGEATSSGVAEEAIRHNIMGTAYLGQQNWADAEDAFRKALALRADDPLLLNNIALAVIQQGEIDRAFEILEQALLHDPDYPFAHYNLGLLDNQNGDFARAAAHFEVVAAFDPEDLFTQYFLGTTLSRSDREDEAVQAYRKALEHDPSHVSSLYGLGRLLLQRGDQEEGRRLIALSQEIRSRSGLDVAVGGQYGEQGPFAMGIDYPGDSLAAPQPIPVAFRAGARTEATLDPAWTLAPLNTDGPASLLVTEDGTLRSVSIDGLSEPLAAAAPDGATFRALAAGDLDNDGDVDLVALLQLGDELTPSLMENTGDGYSWMDGGRFSGAPSVRAAIDDVDLVVVDFDHDGDVDLFWCWTLRDGAAAACKLAVNDGAAAFAATDGVEKGIDPRSSGAGAITVRLSDADNDRDVDLLVAAPGGLRLFTNFRDGTFGDVSERVGLAGSGAAESLEPADVNKDGWMDLILGGDAGLRVRLNRRGHFEPATTLAGPAEGAEPAPAIVLDYDNDGFLDLAGGIEGGVRFLRNLGQGEWGGATVVADQLGNGGTGRPLAAFDADGDGDQDLALQLGDQLLLVVNDGGNANRWIRLASRGAGDNKFGIGAKVEVLAGALRQKFEITRPVALHVGLGERDIVQSARYLWPSGVLQDEVELKTNEDVQISQLDRKGTSCPLLYAWHEGAWRFVTDFLGGCAIGYQHAPGVFSTPDTDEYVRIESGLSEDAQGRLPIRLNNQLEEVIWFDKIELIVVDHPVGTEVYPNERLMPGPPWPEFGLFASNDLRPILSARGLEDGSDQTERLADADRRFVDNFGLLAPKGYAETHTLELDLGPLPDQRRVVLLLDGWIDYADSSANVAAAQAGLQLVPPRLLVADGRNGWFEPEHLMGFPAGLPKTMAVDLTGVFRSPDHRVRIETNMRIYWDRARVMVGGDETPLEVARLQPESAELRFGGFPAETNFDRRKPLAYDPDEVRSVTPWRAHVGAYTSFGDVTNLLLEIDDDFVTTKAGDEIVLKFPSPGPSGAGWTRTYLLYADGFGKDMDPNSAANGRVGPIPFHGMPTYPYPADVVHPRTGETTERSPRLVLPSKHGWPGAVPQALAPGHESR